MLDGVVGTSAISNISFDDIGVWNKALTKADVAFLAIGSVPPFNIAPPVEGRLELSISPADGGGFDLAWASTAGTFYNLRSSADLTGDVATWNLVQGDIEATPDTNEANIMPTEGKLFYAIEAIRESPSAPAE